MQICALACVKLSFIFFYRRIFCTGNGKVHSVPSPLPWLSSSIAWAVSFNIALLFICNGAFCGNVVHRSKISTPIVGGSLTGSLALLFPTLSHRCVMVLVLPMPCVRFTLQTFSSSSTFFCIPLQILVWYPDWPADPQQIWKLQPSTIGRLAIIGIFCFGALWVSEKRKPKDG